MADDNADDWEAVARLLFADEASRAQARVAETFHRLRETAEDGEAFKSEDVQEARYALNRAYQLIEKGVVPLTEGTEPWEHPPDVPWEKVRA